MKYSDRLFIACLFIFSVATPGTIHFAKPTHITQVQAVESPAAEVSEQHQTQAGQTADIQSTPAPVAEKTEKEEIIALIVEVFGEDAPDAFSVLYCENRGLNPNATNHNRNGSIDRGLFQINSVHGGEELFDPETNVKKAYQIFQSRGWTAWACSERVGVKPFWK